MTTSLGQPHTPRWGGRAKTTEVGTVLSPLFFSDISFVGFSNISTAVSDASTVGVPDTSAVLSDASIVGVSDVSIASVPDATFIEVSDSFTAVVSDASALGFSDTFLDRGAETSPLADTFIVFASNTFPVSCLMPLCGRSSPAGASPIGVSETSIEAFDATLMEGVAIVGFSDISLTHVTDASTVGVSNTCFAVLSVAFNAVISVASSVEGCD